MMRTDNMHYLKSHHMIGEITWLNVWKFQERDLFSNDTEEGIK